VVSTEVVGHRSLPANTGLSVVGASPLFGRAIEAEALITAAWRDQSGEALNQAIKICARAQ